MMELLQNPAVQEILKTSGPASLLAMMGWAAWWYERKKSDELTRRLFKISSAQAQSNTRMESALRALREMVRERI
jgi:hypothetical protein